MRCAAPASRCARAKAHKCPRHRVGADRARRGRHLLPEGRRGRSVRRRRHPRRARHQRDRRRGEARAARRAWRGRRPIGVLADDARPWSATSVPRRVAGGRIARRAGRGRRRRASLRCRAGCAGGGARARRSRARRALRFAGFMPITAPRSICATPDARRARDRERRGARARDQGGDRGGRHRVPDGDGRGHRHAGSTSATAASTRSCSPGSYVFMDADYQRNALAPDQHHFEQSLFVLATVMSAPARERAVVDAGLKAFAFDSGLPRGLRRARARRT